jgi:hypothetical protein
MRACGDAKFLPPSAAGPFIEGARRLFAFGAFAPET